MTFPPGTHAMWMRYWLAAGGINPDKDVSLITIPPAQMVANMKVGKMDGFCVGEPWNCSRHRRRHRIHGDHHAGDVEGPSGKGLRVHRGVCRRKIRKTVKAMLKALHEASVWLDKMENRPELAEVVSRPTYINCPPEIILGRLQASTTTATAARSKIRTT